MKIDKKREMEKMPSAHRQVYRRLRILTAMALVLIAVLIWLTLAVLEANDIEPFAEIAQITPCEKQDIACTISQYRQPAGPGQASKNNLEEACQSNDA